MSTVYPVFLQPFSCNKRDLIIETPPTLLSELILLATLLVKKCFAAVPQCADNSCEVVQEALRPLLLRRMKEDVETLPDKEEVIIWVELTNFQRSYYKALYEKQIGALLGGGKNAALPQMRNLAMELRKVCCHPVRLPDPLSRACSKRCRRCSPRHLAMPVTARPLQRPA